MVLPLKVALIGADSGAEIGEERLVLLDQPSDERDASTASTKRPCCRSTAISPCPAMIEVERGAGELEQLAEVDPNPFARFEALAGTDDARACSPARAARRSIPRR